MLHDFAEGIVDYLYGQCSLAEEKKAIYIYGVEISCSTLGGCLSVLVLALLFGKILDGISFLCVFVSIRMFAGGYHAKTYFHCFLVTNSAFFGTFALSEILKHIPSLAIHHLVLLLSLITVSALSPIRNPHHPLTDRKYRRNKFVARTLSIVEGSIFIAVFYLTDDISFFSISVASLAAVAVMMIVPKIQERRV